MLKGASTVLKGERGSNAPYLPSENMQASVGSIIHHAFGLQVMDIEEITVDIQHTIERKPDVLRKVTDQHNNTYILHMELQSTNEREMVYRMVEYRVMLQRKHNLPVKQYVLYTGQNKLSMITSIDEEDFTFRYKIVSMIDTDYKTYLQKDTPEERVLAILANFGEDNETEALTAIVDAVKAVTTGQLSEAKYLEQLSILSELRNPKIKTGNIMNFTSENFKIEDNWIFLSGRHHQKLEDEALFKEREMEMAKEMKKNGIELKIISNVTKLPVEDIVSL